MSRALIQAQLRGVLKDLDKVADYIDDPSSPARTDVLVEELRSAARHLHALAVALERARAPQSGQQLPFEPQALRDR